MITGTTLSNAVSAMVQIDDRTTISCPDWIDFRCADISQQAKDTLSLLQTYKYNYTLYDLPPQRQEEWRQKYDKCLEKTVLGINLALSAYDGSGNQKLTYCGKDAILNFKTPVYEMPESYFQNDNDLQEICFSRQITSIGDCAFSGCRNLSAIRLNDGLISIGKRAFYGCENISAIELPDSITYIGNHAFENCRNLLSVTLPDGLLRLNADCFRGCTNLRRVNGGNLIDICENAFRECRSLTRVECLSGVTHFGKLFHKDTPLSLN